MERKLHLLLRTQASSQVRSNEVAQCRVYHGFHMAEMDAGLQATQTQICIVGSTSIPT